MASKTAVLSVRVVTDAKAGQKGLADTEKSVKGLGDAADKMALPVAAASAGLVLLANEAKNAASEAEQAAGGLASIFGQYADSVTKSAERAAEAVGLSQTDYSSLATVIGAQLKNLGTPMDQVAGKTDELVSKGADLAATFGGTTADAVGALSSLLRGERDPIERYGVSINQATLDAEKLALGLTGLTGAQDKNADLQATMSLLYRQTADATGQFAREADTAAGSQQIATAQWENAVAVLGEGLLPVYVLAAQGLGIFSNFVAENTELVSALLLVVGGFVGILAVFVGTMKLVQFAVEAAAVAQWLYNAALTANPVGIFIALLVALVAVIVILALRWDTVTENAGNFFDKIAGWAEPAIDFMRQLWDWVQRLGGAFGGIFTGGGLSGFGDLGWSGREAPEAALSARSMARVAAAPTPSTRSIGAPYRAAETTTAAAGRGTTIIINGAVDAAGTARQVKSILTGQDARTGSTATAKRGR